MPCLAAGCAGQLACLAGQASRWRPVPLHAVSRIPQTLPYSRLCPQTAIMAVADLYQRYGDALLPATDVGGAAKPLTSLLAQVGRARAGCRQGARLAGLPR